MKKIFTILILLNAYAVSAKTTVIQCSPTQNNDTFSQSYSYTIKLKTFANLPLSTSLKSEVEEDLWIKCEFKDRKVTVCDNWYYPHTLGKVKVMGAEFNCEQI
jgi:hypothetical protein